VVGAWRAIGRRSTDIRFIDRTRVRPTRRREHGAARGLPASRRSRISLSHPGRDQAQCHVPTIIAWVHAGADADDIPSKSNAAEPTVRIDGT
jgi:hypothetical protein